MKDVVDKLIHWYYLNKRDLPWRRDKDPYHVWISEIMLQQTRIEAVISYYYRFMEALPDISSLARVDEDWLLKLWEGLGYYNRARNLKKAAIIIMEKYDGKFPTNYEDILSLPGIGEYTASAISSICFSKKEVTVDGNVMRVFTRFWNDNSNISKDSTRKMIRRKLQEIIPDDAGSFNEGLMELGEVVCLPNGIPKCSICPLWDSCYSFQNKNYFMFPVKDDLKKKEEVDITVIIPVWNGKTVVRKRKSSGLLHNLYEFPNVEGSLGIKEVKKYGAEYGVVSDIKPSIRYTHVFTHKKWKMRAYIVFLESVSCPNLFSSIATIKEKYALPTAFSPFLYQVKEELT